LFLPHIPDNALRRDKTVPVFVSSFCFCSRLTARVSYTRCIVVLFCRLSALTAPNAVDFSPTSDHPLGVDLIGPAHSDRSSSIRSTHLYGWNASDWSFGGSGVSPSTFSSFVAVPWRSRVIRYLLGSSDWLIGVFRNITVGVLILLLGSAEFSGFCCCCILVQLQRHRQRRPTVNPVDCRVSRLPARRRPRTTSATRLRTSSSDIVFGHVFGHRLRTSSSDTSSDTPLVGTRTVVFGLRQHLVVRCLATSTTTPRFSRTFPFVENGERTI
jgi:hypothetical protein